MDEDDKPTTWERLKKWYRKNEDEIIAESMATFVAGFVTYRVVNKAIDGMTVKTIDVATLDDGTPMIILYLKNGSKKLLTRKPAVPQAAPMMEQIFGPPRL